MHRATKFVAAIGAIAGLSVASALPASAACTKLGFSVNDYGKDGPTKDAKQLLDKYIAQWTAERGIKTYRTGTKTVTCELFLNFIVFDEHTCRAEATVCWNEPPGAPGAGAAPVAAPLAPKAKPKAAPPKPTTTAPEAVPPAPKKPPELPKAKAASAE